eukprot:3584745-Alexandrium_andersonii.AAC.1
MKKGVKEILAANERRLARNLLAQEDAAQRLQARGLALVHASLRLAGPGSDASERHVLGALSQYDHNVIVENLR